MADLPQLSGRNPGPSWGYQFLRTADRVLPEFLFKPCRAIGTWIALAGMRPQRAHSRAYLRLVLGREPSLFDVFRHFFAFEESLMGKLRITNGRHIPCVYASGESSFRDWMEQGGPVLLGSMHVGVSDMLGFQIGSVHQRRVFLVRQRVGNSHDTEAMLARFGDVVRIIWVNDPREMLFALKEAMGSGEAIALQCDRHEHSARASAFWFLGAWRLFPVTIYHLSLIFQRPVILSVGLQRPDGRSELHASPRFEALPGESRAETLARAQAHFQAFLTLVEGLLRAHPYAWFNFGPLNPEVPAPTPSQEPVRP